MRISLDSRLIDENTIAFFSLNNTYADSCGNYSFNDLRSGGQFRIIPQFPDRYALYSGTRNKSSNLHKFIYNNDCTIDFGFSVVRNYGSSYFFNFSNVTCGFSDSNGGYIVINNSGSNVGNGISAPIHWYVGDSINQIHHIAITKQSNTYTMYIDGIKVSGSLYAVSSSNEISLVHDAGNDYYSAFVFDFRVSRGIRWTEDFVGNTPLDDPYYFLKEKDNNMYGIQK